MLIYPACTCNNCGQVLVSVEGDDTHNPTLHNVIYHFLFKEPDGTERIVNNCPKCSTVLNGETTTLVQ